jgi:hypothetical protein
MPRFSTEEYEVIGSDILRANRDHVFAVEMTMDGQVCMGTACVLTEPNICGIPVCKAIVQDKHVPFSDQEIERVALLQALRKLYRMAKDRKLRLPFAGIGAGPHGLALHSPSIYADLCQILANHFGYQQPPVAAPQAGLRSCISTLFHHEIFSELSIRGGFYMASSVAEKHGITLDELKAHCRLAGRELEAQGKLLIFQLPTYRWATDE